MLLSQREGHRWRGILRVGRILLLISLVAWAGTAGAQGQDRREEGACAASLPEIYDRVSPAVVTITSLAIDPYGTPLTA